jgi:ADP-ribose pyrophosphatase
MKKNLDYYFELLKINPFLLDNNDNSPIRIITDREKIKKWQTEKIKKLNSLNEPFAWSEIGVILYDPYIIILRDLVEFPNGSEGGFFRLFHRTYLENGTGGVAILCECNGKYLLLHHFRHATRKWHYEIPKGYGEPNISNEDQATIEIREEVGGEINDMVDLGTVFCNTGIEGNPINLFYANLSKIGELEIQSGIDGILWVSKFDLEDMIKSNEIDDSFTIVAFTRARLRGLL